MEVLRRSGTDQQTLIDLQTDVSRVRASPKERALLKLAAAITSAPEAAARAVLDASAAGWTREEVTEAIFVTSLYNMVNRVAVAFALPPDRAHPYDPGSRIPMLSCSAK